MVMTGFLRVCAPGVLLLLTTTTLVQQADGATTSDVAVVCATELAACEVSETCKSCINDLDEDKAEVNQCGDDLGFLEITTSAVESDAETCEEIHAVACCLDTVTEDEQCVMDAVFVSYWLCISEANGCIQDDQDEIDCTEIDEELEELDELAEEDSGATAAASVGIIASTAAAFAGVTCASVVLQLL